MSYFFKSCAWATLTHGQWEQAVFTPKPSSSSYLVDALSSCCINKTTCIAHIRNEKIPLSCSEGFNLFLLFLMKWTNYPQNNPTSFPAGTWLLSLWFCEFNAVMKNRPGKAPSGSLLAFANLDSSIRVSALRHLGWEPGVSNRQHLPPQPARLLPLNQEDIHLPHISCTLIEQNSLPVGKPK